MNKIIQAAQDCVFYHDTQTRKYTGEPYYKHPFRVAMAAMKVPNSCENLVVSALLHDTIEDTDMEPVLIANKYGVDVLNLVVEVTNVYTKENFPNLSRKERHNLEIERLAGVSDMAKTIKLLDRLDNMNDIPDLEPFLYTYALETEKLLGVLDNCSNRYLWHELRDLVQIKKDFYLQHEH